MNTFLRSIFFGFVLTLSSTVYGQFTVFTANASSVDGSAGKWRISAQISRVGRSDVLSTTVLDLVKGEAVTFSERVLWNQTSAGMTGNGSAANVSGFYLNNLLMDSSRKYLLIVTAYVTGDDGSKKVKTETHDVVFDKDSIASAGPTSGGVTGSSTTSSGSSVLKVVKSGPKPKSDFYFAGEILKVSSEKATYSADIKIEPRFGKGKWTYSPFFNLIASTDADADPDTMNIGFRARRSFPMRKNFINGIGVSSLYVSLGGKIESERDFDNTNMLVDPRLTFRIKPIPLHPRRATLYFEPFVGSELGKNLKSPLPEAEHKPVARALAGVGMILDMPIEKGIEEIVVSGEWTRRWLMKRELGFKVNDDKTLSLTEFGRTPRDWVEAKIDIGINKYLTPYIGYEWGQVPPSYKHIDHRLKIGFSFKFGLSKNITF